MDLVDTLMENRRKARRSCCPHCGADIDEDLRCDHLVSYHGMDEPMKLECESCGEEFFIREWVTREYCVGKTEAEADDLDMQRYK